METQKYKILVAMSHKLTSEQYDTLGLLGYEPIYSEKYQDLHMNQIDPMADAEQLAEMADEIVQEARQKDCQAISMVGEPTLQYYVWEIAFHYGMRVFVSTTRRDNKEIVQKDGSVKKIQIFRHVQWREIFPLPFKILSHRIGDEL